MVLTEDGSFTLFVSALQEHYHSVHGAVNESKHVYIDHGLIPLMNEKKNIRLLEVGFGTGLNAMLTWRMTQQNLASTIEYICLEPFRIPENFVKQLSTSLYVDGDEEKKVFETFHASVNGIKSIISDNFSFTLKEEKLEEVFLPEQIDLVYFDAFAPAVQPELWEESIFKKIFLSMNKDGVLITYCAQGKFKRALKAAGFVVESLPGPKGKREITRARKV